MMLPALSKNIVYPLQEFLVRRPTFHYLKTLEESQWYSRPKMEELQLRKLTELFRVALAHSPWHAHRIRAAGIELEGGGGSVTFEDLRRVPVMTKADATENVDSIVWSGVPGGAYKYNTGGSSGQPLIFYFGRLRQASDAAGRIRARRWWGVDVGDREVYLWGAPVELSKTDRIKTIRDRLLNQLVLNAFEMSSVSMDDYADAIQAFGPKCIYGYASSIALLASHVRERGIRLNLPDLKVVCVTGEPLYAHQRAQIEEVFRAPVANEYGSRDIGFTAHETPRGQMLLMSESLILEVLDPASGQPVPAGEIGEAVLTGLCSTAQPFIRYRTGDMVRCTDDRCEQGRGLHVISEVVGRSTDFIVRSDGTIMHALAVIYVLRAIPGVLEFKFIQHSVSDVEILVVTDRHWTPAAAAAITSGTRERLGSDVRVTIREVDRIAAEQSGKYRYVVSHVPLPAGLAVSSHAAGGE